MCLSEPALCVVESEEDLCAPRTSFEVPHHPIIFQSSIWSQRLAKSIRAPYMCAVWLSLGAYVHLPACVCVCVHIRRKFMVSCTQLRAYESESLSEIITYKQPQPNISCYPVFSMWQRHCQRSGSSLFLAALIMHN